MKNKTIEKEIVWTGENHREMFDFLTNSKNKPINNSRGKKFYMTDKNEAPYLQKLQIRIGNEMKEVCINDFIVKYENDDNFFILKDYEKVYAEFWQELVEADGVLNVDAVAKELHDFHNMMEEVSKVYDHISNGTISKPNTSSHHLIKMFDEIIEKEREKAIKEHERSKIHKGKNL